VAQCPWGLEFDIESDSDTLAAVAATVVVEQRAGAE